MCEAKALTLLGLAMRAGQVISGDETAERAVRSGQVAVLLLDEAVSENTRDKYTAISRSKGIPLFEITADLLGKAIGKSNRMVVAVKKGSLAEKLVTLLT